MKYHLKPQALGYIKKQKLGQGKKKKEKLYSATFQWINEITWCHVKRKYTTLLLFQVNCIVRNSEEIKNNTDF